MSNYCNVKFCNLKMTRRQAVNILKEYNELVEDANIKTIAEFLGMIGLEYEEDLDSENIDNISIILGGEYYEGWDFDDILNIIAKNINTEERYIFISHSYDYECNVKYVFYKGKVETINEVCAWADGMDNDLCNND